MRLQSTDPALIPHRSRTAPACGAARLFAAGPWSGPRGFSSGAPPAEAGLGEHRPPGQAGERVGRGPSPQRGAMRCTERTEAVGSFPAAPGALCGSDGAERGCPRCPAAVPPWRVQGGSPGPVPGSNSGWTGGLCWCSRWGCPVPLHPRGLHWGFGGAGEVAALRRDVLWGSGDRSAVGSLGLGGGAQLRLCSCSGPAGSVPGFGQPMEQERSSRRSQRLSASSVTVTVVQLGQKKGAGAEDPN